MTSSNIVAGSNVFLSREDDPRQDPAFVEQVQDYDRLKGIADRRKVDHSIAKFSSAQEEILRTEMRCVYAKNDPCWGYVKSSNRVISACINGECPKIRECNPKYSLEEAKYWRPSVFDKRAYRDPEKLRFYYIVDMVSDEEIGRYDSNPRNEGFEYTIPKNPVLPNKQDQKEKDQKYKIDPLTGRKMVVIGYRWVITDNASYENEELLPIWGYVEEVEEKPEKVAVRRKAKRIEKIQDASPKKKRIGKAAEPVRDPDFDRKEEFEAAVASAITEEIKLTDVDPDIISEDEEPVVLLDNPAELAFVSGTFLISGIEHGIETTHPIQLALIDDYPRFAGRKMVLISNTALKKGCRENNVKAWKALAEQKNLILLHVAERDFYNFSYGDQKSRWTCRNMYGVTHVCVERTDISEMEKLSDGIYPVSIVDDRNTYMILTKSGEPLGRLGKSFVEVIDELKKSEEISGIPANITGISLQVQNGKTEFLGMGHLKFIEY